MNDEKQDNQIPNQIDSTKLAAPEGLDTRGI